MRDSSVYFQFAFKMRLRREGFFFAGKARGGSIPAVVCDNSNAASGEKSQRLGSSWERFGIRSPLFLSVASNYHMKSRFQPRLLALCTTIGLFAAPVLADTLPTPHKEGRSPNCLCPGAIYTRLDLADFTLNGSVKSDKTHSNILSSFLTKGHENLQVPRSAPANPVELDPGAFTVEREALTPARGRRFLLDMPKPIFDTDITYGDLADALARRHAQHVLGADDGPVRLGGRCC